MIVANRTRDHVRFDVLDFYRYAGAVLIALDHYILLYLPLAPSIKARIDLALQPLMGFFFTLSGLVIMHVYDRRLSGAAEYGEYLQKRLARIYPLHLLTLVVAILWGLASHGTYLFSPDGILPNLLLIHAWNAIDHLSFNYPSWSVSAEFFVYLLFPAFLFVMNRVGTLISLLLPIVSAVAIMAFFSVYELGPWEHANYNFGCLRAVPSFIAGMAIYRLAMVRFAKLVVPGWLAHGAALTSLPMMFSGVAGEAVLAFFVIVVFLLARAEPATPGIFSRPFARSLANCSYGFYMWHALVGATMLSLILKVLHLDEAWTFPLAVAAIIVTTLISIGSYRFFESPARRYLGSFRLPLTKMASKRVISP